MPSGEGSSPLENSTNAQMAKTAHKAQMVQAARRGAAHSDKETPSVWEPVVDRVLVSAQVDRSNMVLTFAHANGTHFVERH